MPDLKKIIEEEALKQLKAIEAMETAFNSEAIRLQKELYQLLLDKFIESLATDESGNLLFNTKNISRVNDLNATWAAFQEQHYRPAVIEFAKELISIVDIEAGYFLAVGKEFDIAMNFAGTTELISKQIGIDIATETITEGSYLDRLLQGSQVRNQVADLVLQNVSAKTSFTDLKKSLETLVRGDETTNGAMQQYLRTYAYDTFSNVQAAIDLNIADTYKFNWFTYSGDIIKTTRPFCRDHLNGVYNREDIARFQEEDWAGKNWDVPFEISRGGYNCRHQLMWIPEEAVAYL